MRIAVVEPQLDTFCRINSEGVGDLADRAVLIGDLLILIRKVDPMSRTVLPRV
jgi:hypothetical protein